MIAAVVNGNQALQSEEARLNNDVLFAITLESHWEQLHSKIYTIQTGSRLVFW